MGQARPQAHLGRIGLNASLCVPHQPRPRATNGNRVRTGLSHNCTGVKPILHSLLLLLPYNPAARDRATRLATNSMQLSFVLSVIIVPHLVLPEALASKRWRFRAELGLGCSCKEMEEVMEGVNNLAIIEPHKKNRIQVSNTKKLLFFYVNLAKVSFPLSHFLLFCPPIVWGLSRY